MCEKNTTKFDMQTHANWIFEAYVINLHESGGSEFFLLVLMIMAMMMIIKLVEASHQYCHWPHFLGAFLLDQINHISEMFFAFTSSSHRHHHPPLMENVLNFFCFFGLRPLGLVC